MSIRLVQVSDTHLSPTHGYFACNWAAFRDAMREDPPDLLVHGGDVAFNGPVAPADLEYGGAELRGLGLPWRAIPGNHDNGEAPAFSRLKQPLTAERMAAWRRHIGPQWWWHDIGEWRLVGLDTGLLASGLAEEAEQWAFLEAALVGRAGRPVMLFIHLPPFERDPEDQGFTTACVPWPARDRLLQACLGGGVRVIACGHLHVYRRLRWRGIDIVWAPPTAMVDVRRQQKRYRRFPRPGWLEWRLEGPRARHRLIEPARMFVIDMTAWTATSGGTVTTLPPWRG
jgi:3',5'-cyclic AMP phosphodiesterase CpdA